KATQFSYSVSNVLKLDPREGKSSQTLGECSSCHAFGEVQQHSQDFASVASRANASVDELLPLMHYPDARRTLETIHDAIGQWSSLFTRYLELVRNHDFAG